MASRKQTVQEGIKRNGHDNADIPAASTGTNRDGHENFFGNAGKRHLDAWTILLTPREAM